MNDENEITTKPDNTLDNEDIKLALADLEEQIRAEFKLEHTTDVKWLIIDHYDDPKTGLNQSKLVSEWNELYTKLTCQEHFHNESLGYHKHKIVKGVLGEPSKIQEELDELKDALAQNNKIMALVELSDIYGALESLADNLGVTMNDVVIMSDTTKRAFKNGHRKQKD